MFGSNSSFKPFGSTSSAPAVPSISLNPATPNQQPSSTFSFGGASAAAPASTSLFGQQQQPTQQQQPAATGGLFGGQQQQQQPAAGGGLFGGQQQQQQQQQQPQASTSLFGGQQQQQPQPAQPAGGLFGGSTASGGLFGSKPAAPTAGASTSGLFGGGSAGGLFGGQQQQQQQPAQTSLFGGQPQQQPQQQSSLFGGQQQQQQQQQQPQQSSLFGSQQQQSQQANTSGLLLPLQQSQQQGTPLKSQKFAELGEQQQKYIEGIDSWISQKKALGASLNTAALGEEIMRTKAAVSVAQDDYAAVKHTLTSLSQFVTTLKGRMSQEEADMIKTREIFEVYLQSQNRQASTTSSYRSSHRDFPHEYFKRVSESMRERVVRYRKSLDQIEGLLRSLIKENPAHTPQAVTSTIQAHQNLIVHLAGRIASLESQMSLLRDQYREEYRERTGSLRDPFEVSRENRGLPPVPGVQSASSMLANGLSQSTFA